MLPVENLQTLLAPCDGVLEIDQTTGYNTISLNRTVLRKKKFYLKKCPKDPQKSGEPDKRRVPLGPEAVGKLVDVLMTRENLPNPLILDVSFNHVETEGAKHLARFIQSPNCPQYLTIQLSNTQMNNESVAILTKALEGLSIDRFVSLNLELNNDISTSSTNPYISAPGAALIDQVSRDNHRASIRYRKNHAHLMIPEDAQFSVALCKHKDGVHNFLSFSAVGKDGHYFNLMNVGLRTDQFECRAPDPGRVSGLYSERGVALHKLRYSYKAFDITREEYLAFVESIYSEIKNPYQFKAYLPTESGGNKFRFDYVQNILPTVQHELNGSPINGKISIGNTCRQVAQSAARKYLDIQDWGRGVFRKFFIPLPYTARSYRHSPELNAYAYRSEYPLYSFPRVPKVDPEYAKQNKKILSQLDRIMRRMEILAKDPYSLSHRKFDAWKELYVKLSPVQSDRQPEEIMSELKGWLRSWVKEKTPLMSDHRKVRRHQWFATKSEKLVKKLEAEFQIQHDQIKL